LVNGQAPPGTKSLAELGRWKCYGCGTFNGEEDEAVKVVKEMQQRIDERFVENDGLAGGKNTDPEEMSNRGSGSEEVEQRGIKDSDDGSAPDMSEMKPRRGRPKKA